MKNILFSICTGVVLLTGCGNEEISSELSNITINVDNGSDGSIDSVHRIGLSSGNIASYTIDKNNDGIVDTIFNVLNSSGRSMSALYDADQDLNEDDKVTYDFGPAYIVSLSTTLDIDNDGSIDINTSIINAIQSNGYYTYVEYDVGNNGTVDLNTTLSYTYNTNGLPSEVLEVNENSSAYTWTQKMTFTYTY